MAGGRSERKNGGKAADARLARTQIAAEARGLVRRALKGALGTLLAPAGVPYVSLVTLATGSAGAPLMLLSGLALHTRNLAANPRASLLIDGTSGAGDPLAGGRLSLTGEVRRLSRESAAERGRFLARHPGAVQYEGFGDFAYYDFAIAGAHFVGGFGRIVDLTARDLLVAIDEAAPLLAAEADILAHMNSDHTDAIALYATRLAGEPAGDWRMSGIDPEGFDLVAAERAARIAFEAPVRAPDDARAALASLARKARALNG